MYDKEKEQLNGIIHSNNICIDIIYILYNDKNLDNLINLLKLNYIFNENVYINKYNVKNYSDILEKLFNAVFKLFNNFEAEYIKTCCKVFPDYIGKKFFVLIGKMIILKQYLLINRLEELKTEKKIINGDSEWSEIMRTMEDKEEYTLYEDKSNFIDNGKYFKYIDNIFKEYNIDKEIIKLKEILKSTTNNEYVANIGELYWNETKRKNEEFGNKLKSVFEKLSENLKEKNKK